MVTGQLAEIERSETCGRQYDACVAWDWCRANLREAVSALANGFAPAAARYEAELCTKSPQMQRLYECLDASDGARAWSRAQCAKPDELTPAQCSNLMGGLRSECGAIAGLTAASASNYQCSSTCARGIVTAFTQCATTYSNVISRWTPDEQARPATV